MEWTHTNEAQAARGDQVRQAQIGCQQTRAHPRQASPTSWERNRSHWEKGSFFREDNRDMASLMRTWKWSFKHGFCETILKTGYISKTVFVKTTLKAQNDDGFGSNRLLFEISKSISQKPSSKCLVFTKISPHLLQWRLFYNQLK